MAKKYVYFFGKGKADGNRTMKDVLGGKGSGLAEMTKAGLPVPPGFTIATTVCTIYYKNKAQAAAGDRKGDAGESEEARGRHRREAGRGEESTARLRPIRRQVLHARHDGHDPESRTERRVRRRPQAAHVQWPVRVRQLSPVHPDVRLGGAGNPESGLRARIRGREDGQRREARYRPDRSGPEGRGRTVQESRPREEPEGLSAGSARAVARCAQRGVPVLAESARDGVSPDLRHSRPHRHGGERAGDGVRQYGRPVGHRRRLHAESGDGREGVLRRVPDQRPGRGRGGRHPHAEADRRARSRDAEGVQAAPRASRRGSRSTTRTSRTSSSRSRTSSSSCCRRATASARATRRS